MNTTNKPCPICLVPLRTSLGNGDRWKVDCTICGDFIIDDTCWDDLEGEMQVKGNAEKRMLLSHYTHRMRATGKIPHLTWSVVVGVLENGNYPTAAEQLDNLISWLAKDSRSPGEHSEFNHNNAYTIFGCETPNGLIFILNEAQGQQLLTHSMVDLKHHWASLTLKGWQRFEELKRGKASGTRAFMAMKFGESDLDKFLAKHFKPAVAQTGFTLQTVGDNRKAGLIDDKIRIDIRSARFLIADLTHGNKGAYWEAGYAEGLGKPVIYTCRADVFDDVQHPDRPHFDTNHHLTVKWSESNPQQAMDDLKATIRATILEAKQED